MGSAAIIQARTGSTRLPRKVLQDVKGKPLLWHVIERAKMCSHVDQIIIATTIREEDNAIETLAQEASVKVFRGDVDNVLKRYVEAAGSNERIVRITGDCPLFNPEGVDGMLELCQEKSLDYVCYDPSIPTFETGVEVVTLSALKKALQNANDFQKEHVTLYIREHPEQFKVGFVRPPSFLQRKDVRVTVDYLEDLEFIRTIYDKLYQLGKIIDLKQVVKLVDQEPSLKTNLNMQSSQANLFSGSDEIKQRLLQAGKFVKDL